MYPDLELKEKVVHGTPKNPITALHFTAGPGTPYPEYFFVGRHWHPYVEILLIKKESYLFEINLENHVLKEGDICILNSEELHQITGQSREAAHEVLLFDPQILGFSYQDEWQEQEIEPFLNHRAVLKNFLRPEDPGYQKIRQLLEQVMEAADRVNQSRRRELEEGGKEEHHSGQYIRCKLFLLELFYQMTDKQLLLPKEALRSASDMWKISRYKTIISYIEAHYQEPVSLRQMADAIPCNSQYLCRFFKEIAGVSPIQYLIAYRIQRSCSLLVSTSRPILEIALDCGFENISYFIRKFKEAKGCTPKEFRKQNCQPHSLL